MNDETEVTEPVWMQEPGRNNLIGVWPSETIDNACNALDALTGADLEGASEETLNGYNLLIWHIRDALRWEQERVRGERIPEDEVTRKQAADEEAEA